MLTDSSSSFSIYTFAWIGVALTFLYFSIVAIALHWKSAHAVDVTRYEPPENISPALAAFLIENGRCERAFAAALISLAAKGFLTIHEDGDRFALKKLKDADASLSAEESCIFESFFQPGFDKYEFRVTDVSLLTSTLHKFEKAIAEVAEPDFISRHWGLWYAGTVFSMLILMAVLGSLPVHLNGRQLPGILYLCLLGGLCGGCFISALRVWPATFRKIISRLPGVTRPARPFNISDTVPFVLSTSALVGFGLLASNTSNQVALLVSAVLLMDVAFHHLCEAPTAEGREVIEELKGFRSFLARAEADRLNRENRPGSTPETLETNNGYAVALNVERGWGEEFTANLLQLLEMDRAYTFPTPSIDARASLWHHEEPIQLNIFARTVGKILTPKKRARPRRKQDPGP
jgi:predicted membrane protein DUF2207